MNDDDIRSLIARSDPARSLAPATPNEKRRLMETAMTQTDPATGTDTARTERPRRRVAILAVVGAAAAAAAIAVVIPLALSSPSSQTVTLALPATGGPMDMCAPVSAGTIATADTAFRGRVTEISDGAVTLTVTDRFAGEPGDTVEIVQGEDTAVDGAPITFTDGATYLVAASDGLVLTCGSSAEDSPELEAVYQQAFPS